MFPLAKETRVFLLLMLGLAIVFQYQFGLLPAVPLWLLLILLAYYLRDFQRDIPSIPLANVSPVDGRVRDVVKAHDPYLKRDALKISIRQRLSGEFNAHSPIEGKVMERWFNTQEKSSSDMPLYHFAIWIRTDEEDDVVVEVDLSTLPRYYECHIQPGERVGQGKRCGFIGFGRQVNVYLPDNAVTNVKSDDKVKAGSDVIATFVREP